MDSILQDIRVALRGFHRTPVFVIAVLAILGLGIGMAVAMFTTFQAVLVRRLPVIDQNGIAVLWPYWVPGAELSPPATDLPALRRASHTMREIAGVAHFGTWTTPFLDGDRTLVFSTTPVSGNYFDVLGAHAALGRLLRPEDEAPGSRVMVLSYRAWRSKFGASPAVLGRALVEPYSRSSMTVVGVAPAGLDYPVGVDAWTPIIRGASPRVLIVARLASGASVSAARAEFFAIIHRLEPGMKFTGADGSTFAGAMLGGARPILAALTAAVGLLLLIACANVGTLFLVRAASRTRELAVRRALGASYGALVRQLVIESVLLAAAGGALGAACAALLLRVLLALAPAQLPRVGEIGLRGSLLAIAVGVTAVSVLLFGVLPALAAAHVNLGSPLRLDPRTGAETRGRRRVRQWLVASQVALALVMLTGAGLLVRSLRQLEQLPLGYRTEHLSILSVAYDAARFDSDQKLIALGDEVMQRLRSIPGVVAVTPTLTLPFGGANINIGVFEPEAQNERTRDVNTPIPWETAGGDYFRTFGIPILRGRAVLQSDRTETLPVVVVSQAVARRFWPGQDPVGKRLRLAPAAAPPGAPYPARVSDWRTVVGVVPDTRLRELRETSPTIYVPWRQNPVFGYFAVRSRGDVAGLTTPMRRAVRDADPTVTLWNVQSIDDLLSAPLAEPRLSALLLAGFGSAALLLAAVGLYGVMTSTVREQTREIGIRVALGATPALIRTAVLRQALLVAGAGAAIGLLAALALTRLLRTLLFQMTPTDPLTLAGVCVLLLGVALFAAYLPARRATRVDPAQALRAE